MSRFHKLDAGDVLSHWLMIIKPFLGDDDYQDDIEPITHKVRQGRCFLFVSDDGLTSVLLSYINVPADAICVEFMVSDTPFSVRKYWRDYCDIAHAVGKTKVICRAMTASRERLFQQMGFIMMLDGRLCREMDE